MERRHPIHGHLAGIYASFYGSAEKEQRYTFPEAKWLALAAHVIVQKIAVWIKAIDILYQTIDSADKDPIFKISCVRLVHIVCHVR